MSQTLPTPDPDNVEALADAINRFHGKLDADLREDAALRHIFAQSVIGRATVVVHFDATEGTGGDA